MGRRHHVKGTAELRGAASQNIKHARIIIRRQYDRAAMDHSRFFAGDLADRRAEELGVVRPLAALITHIENHYVAIHEGDEGNQGQSFEIRRDDTCAIGGSAELLDRG